MALYHKLKWMVAIIMVFLIILATNLIDKDNFAKVEESVESIYEDVLLTKDRIMELTVLIHEMEVAFILEDAKYYEIKSASNKEHIVDILADCNKVVETKQEEDLLFDLQQNCETLFTMKSDTLMFEASKKKEMLQQFELIKYNIIELGDIHVEEGRKHKLRSRSFLDITKLFSRIEIYFLVFLSIALIFVLLHQPNKSEE